jgi:hypothetical protein
MNTNVNFKPELQKLAAANAALPTLSASDFNELTARLTERSVGREDIARAATLLGPLVKTDYISIWNPDARVRALGYDPASITPEQSKNIAAYADAVSNLTNRLYARSAELAQIEDLPRRTAIELVSAVIVVGGVVTVGAAATAVHPLLGAALAGAAIGALVRDV